MWSWINPSIKNTHNCVSITSRYNLKITASKFIQVSNQIAPFSHSCQWTTLENKRFCLIFYGKHSALIWCRTKCINCYWGMLSLSSIVPWWATSRVVVLQPEVSHFAQWEGCGQQEHIDSSSLKHRLVRICEVVYVTLSLWASQLHCHLQDRNNVLMQQHWLHTSVSWRITLVFVHISAHLLETVIDMSTNHFLMKTTDLELLLLSRLVFIQFSTF